MHRQAAPAALASAADALAAQLAPAEFGRLLAQLERLLDHGGARRNPDVVRLLITALTESLSKHAISSALFAGGGGVQGAATAATAPAAAPAPASSDEGQENRPVGAAAVKQQPKRPATAAPATAPRATRGGCANATEAPQPTPGDREAKDQQRRPRVLQQQQQRQQQQAVAVTRRGQQEQQQQQQQSKRRRTAATAATAAAPAAAARPR